MPRDRDPSDLDPDSKDMPPDDATDSVEPTRDEKWLTDRTSLDRLDWLDEDLEDGLDRAEYLRRRALLLAHRRNRRVTVAIAVAIIAALYWLAR